MIHPSDKVLITGCAGMLGEAVYPVFKDSCQTFATDIDLNEPWLERLDVGDAKAVAEYLERVKPNYIVHLAAKTDMEWCELHPEETYRTNSEGVENLAKYAREHNIPLLYISTAGVFDGAKDEYYEHDTPNPLSVYGKSKYGGELVAKTVPKHVIIRAGWMMGGGPRKDKKFINKIVKQLRAGVTELAVVNDKLGTPCYTYDLARSIKHTLDHEAYGIYHGACDGGGSRADVARFMLEHLDLDRKVEVNEVDSSFFKESYFATRPRSEQLVNTELKKLDPGLTRDWKVCLEEYLKKFDWHLWDMNTSGMERSFYRGYFDIEKRHWLMKGRRALAEDMLKKFLPKEPKDTKALDFGCGSGLFVSELAEQGYESHGLDISAEAVKLGEVRGVKNLGVIDSHKIDFPDGAFDVIFALDVLGHLEDEAWALKEMHRVLRPGGIVIASVPAYEWMWGVQDEAAHHYRRYTKSELIGKIRKSGAWDIVHSTYFNTFLFVPIALVRLLSRAFNLTNRHSDFDINNEWMNRLFGNIFDDERAVLRRMSLPFGVSALAVFRKPPGK